MISWKNHLSKFWESCKQPEMHAIQSCRQTELKTTWSWSPTDMFSLSKNRSYGRSVFWSPSLSPLWQAQSFLREISQPTTISQVEDTLWMDRSLGMIIHSENIVSVLQPNTITHSAANSENMMVLSCSWTGEFTSVKLLHLNGASSGILSREVPLLSADKGGKMSMKLMVVMRLKLLKKLAKVASGHLQQLVGINKFPNGWSTTKK